MAKATVTPSTLDYNGDEIIDEETCTTDGAEITPIGKCSNLAILVVNTSAAAMTVTVADGANFTGGTIGDLTVTVAATSKHWIGPLEGHRFLDSSGKIQMDFSSTTTVAGTVSAIELP